MGLVLFFKEGLTMIEFRIPAALEPYRKLRIWVAWKWETPKAAINPNAKPTKPTKVLYQPDNPDRKARSNDPKTWGDADAAIAAGLDGIGLCLQGGELGAIDLDKVATLQRQLGVPDVGVVGIPPYVL